MKDRTTIFKLLVCHVCLALAGACAGDGDNTIAAQDVQSHETVAGDTGIELTVTETVLSDMFSGDGKRTEDVPGDGLPDFAPVDLGPLCRAGEGCFLDKCQSNDDCQSGWCVDHLGESVCTLACQDECPPGWSCQQVAGSVPDLVFVCVSDYTNLCRPCSSGNDCKSPVGAEDVCVDYGTEGNFCGGTCGPEQECPWGFSCKESSSVDGIETTQCLADAGICPCTSTSVQLSLWTPCEVVNEWGACQGMRVCGEDGLTDCDAPVPSFEQCNGEDDDCDGLVDEPEDVGGNYESLCDDANLCTTDICAGEDGCAYESLSGTECMDGDVCTTADHCDQGECVGSPVICDDKNPCTDDMCTAQGGCEYVPNTSSCDDGDPCTLADQCFQSECSGVGINCDCLEDEDCKVLEDGNLCNGTLVCDTSKLPHKCEVSPDTVVDCVPPQGPESICLKAWCNPDDGSCLLLPDHEGFACSKGDKCIVGAECVEGDCQGGFPLNCEDGNPCTLDSCKPKSGCEHAAAEGGCSDGDVCSVGDYCEDGQCQPGPPLVCDDANPCTQDACQPATGCVHTPTVAPGESCCETPDDCPADYSYPSQCDSQSSCQGTAKMALCVNHQCGAKVTEDDSACIGLADACGGFKDIVCTGEEVQIPQACVGFCISDQDCDPFTHCDGTCKPDLPIGQECSEDSQCESGNCNPVPDGVHWFCNAAMHECALDDGTGVHDGFKYCWEGDVWSCLGPDTWQMTECQSDCGYYDAVDGCQGAKCTPCPSFCGADDECDPNAHCDGQCLEDLVLGLACDEDSDCASGNCGEAPGGTDHCIPLTDECALDDGDGVDTGFGLCLENKRWQCKADGTWSWAGCADDCGWYQAVDQCIDGDCVLCPTGCDSDEQCDPQAHCDGQCQANLADGEECDEDTDCTSGHCANGFCCASSDCCQVSGDCPLSYTADPECDDAEQCQGQRIDAVCVTSMCGSTIVPDDSACSAETTADDCGLYPTVYCTGQPDQQAPVCPQVCAGDEQCDAQAHCDDAQCVPDLDLGADCDENSDCSGQLCHQLRCCKEACTTQGCLTGECDENGDCASYTDGHHNCAVCHSCGGDGQCAPQTNSAAAATALGCSTGDEGCRYCEDGQCKVYTSGQHGCPANHACDAQGVCKAQLPQYKVVCFGNYPQNAWVSAYCPAGYHHYYHVCGANGIDSYSWGPYYDDKYLESNGHCACCCNCNSVCVKCELN